jgi:hypothetical protein
MCNIQQRTMDGNSLELASVAEYEAALFTHA